MQRKAAAIYNKYVADSAEKLINVDAAGRTQTCNELGQSTANATIESFDDLQSQVSQHNCMCT